MSKFNTDFQKNHNTKDSRWKTFKDYVDCLPNQDSIIKRKDNSVLASCPLGEVNHKHGDKHQSFILNEVWSKKYKRDVVVFTCLSNCCSQHELGNFFRGRLGL
tara:strand:- start:595 stop:903 length:309 start_codon:yes stop_codon:yes gene_type:complete